VTTIESTGSRTDSAYRLGVWQMLTNQWHVLVALMLRDLKSRFFGSSFGYLLVVAWPLSHVVIMIVVNSFARRLIPYGDSAALWFSTGAVPYIAFAYTARFTMLGIVMNKQLLVFPQVKILDILFARAIVEILNAGLVILILCLSFLIIGIDFTPINAVQACFAIGACLLLGLGTGILNAIIAAGFRPWITGYALLNIIAWITSGVIFVPQAFPEPIRYALSFSPLVHGIEWLRSAYYEGYGDGYLDKGYLLGWGISTVCLGLVLERLVRGRLLQS
jgi:capsular polysaccharide transport system permease protein